MRVSLKKYEAVSVTAESGSLTRAAQILGYTQSGISHMITSLEEELGVQLLTRKRGGAVLTAEGEQLMPLIDQMLGLHREVERLAGEMAKGGQVRIGAFTSVAVNWLPGILRMFREKYPEVRVVMLNGDYSDVNHWLLSGEIDIGFIALPGPAGCECIPLAEDPLSVVVPLGHRFCQMERVPIEEAAKEPIISLLQASSHDVHRALDSAGVRPEIRYTTKDDYAIIAMVREGLGVSIMPELLLKGQVSGVEVRRLSPPAYRTIALAVAADRKRVPAVRSFTECVTQWLQTNGTR